MTVRNLISSTTTAASNTVTAAGSGLAAALQIGEAFATDHLKKTRARTKFTRNAWAVELVADVREREAAALGRIAKLGLSSEDIQSDVDSILAEFK